MPISAVQRNGLRLYWSPTPRRFQTSTNCIPRSYPSIQVLGFIIGIDNRKLPEVIEDILRMEDSELKLVVRGLSSLMDGNGEYLNEGVISYEIPYFAHASFYDYLFNSSRSGPFHVNRLEYENQVTIRSFTLIIQLIRSRRQVIFVIISQLFTFMTGCLLLPTGFYVPQLGIILPLNFQTGSVFLQSQWRKWLWQALMT